MPDVRVLATDLQFPEGPVAMLDGSVLLVEIRGQRLTRVWPDGRKEGAVRVGALGDMHCTKAMQGKLQPLLAQAAQAADVLLLCGDLTDHGQP